MGADHGGGGRRQHLAVGASHVEEGGMGPQVGAGLAQDLDLAQLHTLGESLVQHLCCGAEDIA